MAGKLEGDSWMLRISAVLMLVCGTIGIFYSIALVIPFLTGTVAALQLSVPVYLTHLLLSFLMNAASFRFGFLALAKPQMPMKKILHITEGVWLLAFAAVYQMLHLFFERYLGEGLLLPAVLAAAQIALTTMCILEKKKIAGD